MELSLEFPRATQRSRFRVRSASIGSWLRPRSPRSAGVCHLCFVKCDRLTAHQEAAQSYHSLPETLCLWAREPLDLWGQNISHLAERIRGGNWASGRMQGALPNRSEERRGGKEG